MNRPKGRTRPSVADRWFETQAGNRTQSPTLSRDDLFVLAAGTLLTAVVVYDVYRKVRENSGRMD